RPGWSAGGWRGRAASPDGAPGGCRAAQVGERARAIVRPPDETALQVQVQEILHVAQLLPDVGWIGDVVGLAGVRLVPERLVQRLERQREVDRGGRARVAVLALDEEARRGGVGQMVDRRHPVVDVVVALRVPKLVFEEL